MKLSAERVSPVQKAVPGIGEMADRIRAHAWHLTPIGPLERWSKELVSTVNLMLALPSPASLYWGADLIELYNDAYKEPVLGARHPNALGMSVREVWREAWHIIGPQIEAAFLRGETTSEENILIPIEKDGRMVDVYWHYTLFPLYEEGKIMGVFNTCHNVTETVLAARERDCIAEQLTQVLDATTDGVACIDRDWRITYLNHRAKEILALSGDVVGVNMWKAFPGTVYEGSPYMEHYHGAMDERVAGSFEAFYPEPLNAWLKVLVQPSRAGIVIFFRDVTAHKQAEATLVQSEKLAVVGRLASAIAHEINNPLDAVTNLLFLARMDQGLSAQTLEYFDQAERELSRISIITHQTLGFQRHSNHPTLTFCQVMIEGGLAVYGTRILKSRVKVELRKRALKPVMCFEGEIRQVVNNLLGNALDAMEPDGGRLLIRSRETSDWRTGRKGLMLTFADTGAGIDPQVLGKIFNPFFTTKEMHGTGLGLWVCQEIIARHQGALRVRSSQRQGRSGTVFTLLLPFDAVNRPQ